MSAIHEINHEVLIKHKAKPSDLKNLISIRLNKMLISIVSC